MAAIAAPHLLPAVSSCCADAPPGPCKTGETKRWGVGRAATALFDARSFARSLARGPCELSSRAVEQCH